MNSPGKADLCVTYHTLGQLSDTNRFTVARVMKSENKAIGNQRCECIALMFVWRRVVILRSTCRR